MAAANWTRSDASCTISIQYRSRLDRPTESYKFGGSVIQGEIVKNPVRTRYQTRAAGGLLEPLPPPCGRVPNQARILEPIPPPSTHNITTLYLIVKHQIGHETPCEPTGNVQPHGNPPLQQQKNDKCTPRNSLNT